VSNQPSHLHLVVPEPKQTEIPALDPKNIENLDPEALKETMLKGIYVLEAVLFSQASFECNRIGEVRELIKTLEAELLDKEKLKDLDPFLKIRLYRTLQDNMNTSLGFLQNLHQNIASGISALNHMEKAKIDKETETLPEVESQAKKEMLFLIREKIRQKVERK